MNAAIRHTCTVNLRSASGCDHVARGAPARSARVALAAKGAVGLGGNGFGGRGLALVGLRASRVAWNAPRDLRNARVIRAIAKPTARAQRGFSGPRSKEDAVKMWARVAVFAAPILWATSAPLSRYLYTLPVHPGPLVVTWVKYLFAAVCFVPAMIDHFTEEEAKRRRLGKRVRKVKAAAFDSRAMMSSIQPHIPLLKFAAFQASALFLGAVLATYSLQFSAASKAEFVVNSGKILFVPLLALLGGSRIRAATWRGMFAAMLGVVLIFWDGALIASDLGLVAASLCYSVHTVYVSAGDFNPMVLTGVEMVMLAGISSVLVAMEAISSPAGISTYCARELGPLMAPGVLKVIGFMGIGATSLAMLCQSFGQNHVPAATAQVVYSTQPVWASVYSIMLLGEGLGARATLGALIVVATSIFCGSGSSGDEAGKPKVKAVAA